MALRKVSIIGVGTTPFGILEGETLTSMAVAACNQAIKDAGIDRKLIQAFYLGNHISGMLLGQETMAPTIAAAIALQPGIPCTKVEGACSSGSISLREAYLMIATGVYDFILAAGVEKMSLASREKMTQSLSSSLDMETEGATGMTFPGYWALIAKRYLHEYGCKVEHFAMVAAKNRSNAAHNPRARFQKPVTIEEVLSSKLITDPLRLFDCCPVADGAAAAVLCPAEIATEFSQKPIDIIGTSQTSGYSTLYEQAGLLIMPATITAGEKAFEMAGIKRQDVDLVELHDCFSPAEIVESEDLGFFPKGTAWRALEEGVTQVGGKLPISPSGGLLSKGHAVGATGLGQTYEVVKQLRGEHENQVKDAEIGLTHNGGGAGAVACVTILRRR